MFKGVCAIINVRFDDDYLDSAVVPSVVAVTAAELSASKSQKTSKELSSVLVSCHFIFLILF